MRLLITGGENGEPFAFAQQHEFFESHVDPWVLDCCTAIQNSPVANSYRRVAEFTQSFMAIERDSFAIG
jgi:TorA maturation chaperone TorD